MKIGLDDYTLESPARLDVALACLAEDPNVVPIAGGTDLMVVLEAGRLPAGRYLDLWGLDELRGIEVTSDRVTIGALTTYTELQDHPVIAKEFPLLVAAARQSGALAIQNRGTLGGNIINASPAADSPPALIAYAAELELRSVRGPRMVPYRAFHSGYKTMDRARTELLRAIVLPRRPELGGALHLYRKVGTRKAQAITKVGLAAVGLLANGRVAHVGLALSSVAPTVVHLARTEAAVCERELDAGTLVEALACMRGEIAPIDDVRSNAAYRAHVASALVEDFLHQLSGRPG